MVESKGCDAQARPPLATSFALAMYDRNQLSRKLRISLNDICNLACFFCHNEGQGRFGRVGTSRFTPGDYQHLVEAAVNAGIREVKLTGGEPLLYTKSKQNIVDLVAAISSLRDKHQFGLSLITNGLLLAGHAQALKDAGLDRVTISLHTLDETKHNALISRNGGRRDSPADILTAIQAAVDADLTPVKVNTVIFGREHGSNLSELPAIIDACKSLGVAQLRLYTLLKHDRFTDHADWYRFWDNDLLAEVGAALYQSQEAAADFMLWAERSLRMRQEALYPKPVLAARVGPLEVTIEDMESGRFERQGVPDEGPYSLRVTASGKLIGVLSDKAPSLELAPMLRPLDIDALQVAFRTARAALFP